MGDDLIEIIEGYPFPVALRNASQVRWSGILRAVRDSEQVGVVVMRDGHVAWAVSNIQTENFASFLERIGMVPKEKLNEVVRKYRTLGKSGKLGALLEEAGLISHATLRECLKAHLHAAITSMLDDPRIFLEARNGELSIDDGMVFMLSEVCPDSEAFVAASEQHRLPPGGAEEQPAVEAAILECLAALPGYLYSFVADMTGKVLTLHVQDGMDADVDTVVPAVLAWLSTSSLSSSKMEIGRVMFAFLQGEAGSLFVHMTDTDSCFLAVACDEDARLGVVKHKIAELLPVIRNRPVGTA